MLETVCNIHPLLARLRSFAGGLLLCLEQVAFEIALLARGQGSIITGFGLMDSRVPAYDVL
jgi:hypothetical protein